ncbi:MAG: (2Fe-2S)-binding protein [Chloroflexota bacterium]|nr:(2Fe-2S)-binding protein [Chloroflexota bacterium]
MYVCLCRVVTRSTIESAIAHGARTVQEVGERCAAGTDCGKCQRTIIRLLTLAAEPPRESLPVPITERSRGA